MIRRAARDDAAAVAAVYAPYVLDTTISFEETPPDDTDMAARIESSHCWFVLVLAGGIAGFAYAAPFHHRPAYRWSAEVSIYLAPDATGHGHGRALARRVLDELQQLGFANAFAGIALPNPASVRVFESLGFEQAALFRSVGCKHGKWLDVGWWQLRLGQ